MIFHCGFALHFPEEKLHWVAFHMFSIYLEVLFCEVPVGAVCLLLKFVVSFSCFLIAGSLYVFLNTSPLWITGISNVSTQSMIVICTLFVEFFQCKWMYRSFPWGEGVLSPLWNPSLFWGHDNILLYYWLKVLSSQTLLTSSFVFSPICIPLSEAWGAWAFLEFWNTYGPASCFQSQTTTVSTSFDFLSVPCHPSAFQLPECWCFQLLSLFSLSSWVLAVCVCACTCTLSLSHQRGFRRERQ